MIQDENIKEIYAYFGLTFYCANCLEHQIVNTLIVLEVLPQRKQVFDKQTWEGLVDKYYDQAFAKTLGYLKKQLEKHIIASQVLMPIMVDLEKCLDERNFLAHHFFRGYSTHWFSKKGRKKMIIRLENARKLFESADNKLDIAFKTLSEKYGFTEEIFNSEFEKMKYQEG